MSTKLAWTSSAEISGGPSLKAGSSTGINAYALIEETVPAHDPDTATDGTLTVEIQPSGDVTDLRAFAMTSDVYHEDLTWTIKTAADAEGAKDVPFDAALFLYGSAIGSLLTVAPQKITFTNALEQAIDIRILVGRVTS